MKNNGLKLSKKIIQQAKFANSKYKLIYPQDKILVGFSGGKDSLTLLHILSYMQKYLKFDFEFEAVTIKYGMGENLEYLSNHCQKYNIKHKVIETNIFELCQTKSRENSSFCSFVSRMRRGELYQYALDNKFNKLALGHHLNDSVETLFMNMFYNSSIRAMPPKYKAKNGLWVIRPLIFVQEGQLKAFASLNNIEVVGNENCPGLQKVLRKDIKMPKVREEIKAMINKINADNPKIMDSIKSSLSNIQLNSLFDENFLDK
jgi:tRNA(Ile)-lysidine synthetase-like protein